MVKSVVLRDGNSENPYILWDNLETAGGRYHYMRGQVILSEEIEGQRVVLWKGPKKEKNPREKFDFEVLDLIPASEDDENKERVYRASVRYAREIAHINDIMFLDDTERGKPGEMERKLISDLKFMR